MIMIMIIIMMMMAMIDYVMDSMYDEVRGSGYQ